MVLTKGSLLPEKAPTIVRIAFLHLMAIYSETARIHR